MAQVGIREYDAKQLLQDYFGQKTNQLVLVTPETKLTALDKQYSWLTKSKLVVKPDQLFGKRGKHGLVLLNANLSEVIDFIKKNMDRTVTIGKTTGQLTHFLIEPFTPHKEEFYVAIKSEREGDRIYFSNEGGVEVEENWGKVKSVLVPMLVKVEAVDLMKDLIQPALINVQRSAKNKDVIKKLGAFIENLYNFYVDLHFTYLELNPFTIVDGKIVPLDMVARVDDTASFEVGDRWGDMEFPVPFGRSFSKEEEFINSLDAKSGSSLKLTVLNPAGRIWTMVAGGGASVIYADTIGDLGYQKELANYGEYSGNPTTDETCQYASTILDLMTRPVEHSLSEFHRARQKHPQGKILIIGGGIANFTDVAKTFQGIIMALKEYAAKLKQHNVRIYVRRGGPNYEQGLKNIKIACDELKLPIEVYGPELHMTRVVRMALE